MKATLCLVLTILLASTVVLGAPHHEQGHGHHHGQSGAGGTSFEPAHPHHHQGGTSGNHAGNGGHTSFEPVNPHHSHQHTSHAQQG